MRFTDKWQDYRLLDCSGGEKLESWGKYVLVRPDPQVIWKSPRDDVRWRRCDARYFRSDKGGGNWQVYRKLPPAWQVSYGDLTFNIKTMGFKHTGLFPEQAVNWDFLRSVIRAQGGRRVSVLNLFAYTGGATIACLKEGASVVHVDASKGMVQWAKENAKASGVDGGDVRWIVDDCIKFVEREIRRGHFYDIIILDPPSYGRGPKGEVWRLEDSIYDFMQLCCQLLSKQSLMVLLNSYTTGLSASVMQYILADLVQPKFGGVVTADEIGLPVERSGGILPCGATAVWMREQWT